MIPAGNHERKKRGRGLQGERKKGEKNNEIWVQHVLSNMTQPGIRPALTTPWRKRESYKEEERRKRRREYEGAGYRSLLPDHFALRR